MQGDFYITPFMLMGVSNSSGELIEPFLSSLPDEKVQEFSDKAALDFYKAEEGSVDYIKANLKLRLASSVMNDRNFPMGKVLTQNRNSAEFDPNNDEHVKLIEIFFNSIYAEYAGSFKTLNSLIKQLFPDDADMQEVSNYTGPTYTNDHRKYNVHTLMDEYSKTL